VCGWQVKLFDPLVRHGPCTLAVVLRIIRRYTDNQITSGQIEGGKRGGSNGRHGKGDRKDWEGRNSQVVMAFLSEFVMLASALLLGTG